MKYLCPVCKKELQDTDNPKVFMCKRKKIQLPEFEGKVETVHCTLFLDDEDKPFFKEIEVLPYVFQIHDSTSLKQTRIIEVIDDWQEDHQTHWAGAQHRRNLITVPGAMNVNWNKKKEVFERVKMYMLFS